MHLDRLERQVAVERQVTATFLAGGVKGLTMPTFDLAHAEFDAALCAAPQVVGTDRAELLAALGVGRG